MFWNTKRLLIHKKNPLESNNFHTSVDGQHANVQNLGPKKFITVQLWQIKNKHVKYASPPAPSKMFINHLLFEHININKHPGFCSVAIDSLIILGCYVVS
jgi:hypothetical protein